MADGNGTSLVSHSVKGQLKSTPEDKIKPYDIVTNAGLSVGDGGYYLVFGQAVPPIAWGDDEVNGDVRINMVAKLFFTREVMERFVELLIRNNLASTHTTEK